MGCHEGPRWETDGLKWCVDPASSKSYSGSGSDVYDLSSGNYSSTITSATHNGTGPKSFVFAANPDRIETSSSTWWTTPTSMSVSTWFKMTGGGGTYRTVIHKSNTGATSVGSSQFWTGITAAGTLCATIGAATGGIGWAAGNTTTTGTLDIWWNLAAVWNGANVRVFINGVYNKQYDLGEYPVGDYAVRVGASGDAGTYQVIGKIPMVTANHNVALSDEQVAQNFDTHKSRFGL